MTLVSIWTNDRERQAELCVRGHAGFDAYGRDMVCAAASILAHTAVALAKEYEAEGAEAETHVADGDVRVAIRFVERDAYERCRAQWRAVEVGYELLARAYPAHVRITQKTI